MTTYNGTSGNDTFIGGNGNDTVNGGAGNDNLYGGGGADSVNGGSGDDTVSGGAGNDTVYGGIGNDTVYGDGGNDTLYGDAGNDYVDGGAGNDSVSGGDGQDTLYGGANKDTLSGGAGDDHLSGGDGNDVMSGDGGNDWLTGGRGDDTVYGGSGQDTLTTETGSGNDVLYGGEDADGADRDMLYIDNVEGVTVKFTGDESGTMVSSDPGGGTTSFYQMENVWAGYGNDTIDAIGSTTAHWLGGYVGDDLVIGGSGNDGLSGEADNDTLKGGRGDDRLSGGSGNDTFVMETVGGGDTIIDFDLGDADNDGLTNDRLDVSDLRDAQGHPVKISDVVVSSDGNGNAVLTFPGGESVTLQGISAAQVNQGRVLHSMGIPCFTSGTMIRTSQGERAVEDITAGDLMMTPHGAVPVLWHGASRLGAADLDARPDLWPVVIAAGAIGNRCELRLSPQHAVLVPGQDGDPDSGHLIRARHLAQEGSMARVARGVRQVSYHHLLLPKHAMVWAEAALVESFYPGKMAVAGLSMEARISLGRVIVDLYPMTGAATLDAHYGPRCQAVLSRRQALDWLGGNSRRKGIGNQRRSAGIALPIFAENGPGTLARAPEQQALF